MSTKNMSDAVSTTESQFATEDQLGHILEMWKRRLKNRRLTREEGQLIITDGGLYLPVMDQAADVLVDRVRTNLTNTVIRIVKVNRNRTPQEVLDATKRNQYTDKAIVKTMPKGEGDEVEVTFFKLGRYISDADLAKEYEARGLRPDQYAQAAVNEADPGFADEHPNGSHWQRTDGGYNFLTFSRWNDERSVYCNRNDNAWNDPWWFAGVRK
jgi:hypothetical protein